MSVPISTSMINTNRLRPSLIWGWRVKKSASITFTIQHAAKGETNHERDVFEFLFKSAIVWEVYGKKTQLDGFVPRRSPSAISASRSLQDRRLPATDVSGLRRREVVEARTQPAVPATTLAPSRQHGLTRQDVDDSLREIDEQTAKSQRNPSTAGH